MENVILTLNCGSSSVKFAVFVSGHPEKASLRGQVSGIGTNPHLEMKDDDGETIREDGKVMSVIRNHGDAINQIMERIERHAAGSNVIAVGHRVVHGGINHYGPAAIDETLISELSSLSTFAPLHQPHNLAGIRAAQSAYPMAHQVACFDTSFHRTHPWVNDAFALPREYYDKGIRRYGFHGLSYEYISHAMKQDAPHHHQGDTVVCHLGNGASMCAIRAGQSVGSTMGFTALDGLPMGTRCGQLDPGVVLYLMAVEKLSPVEIENMLYRESGLKGLSGISSDMRTLLQSDDPHALQAIEYFTYRIRREIGGMAAVLNGLDALVFCGGIGENAWQIRQIVCEKMEWIGLELDEVRNRENRHIISSDRSRARIFVIPTDEEQMIARHTLSVLAEQAVTA